MNPTRLYPLRLRGAQHQLITQTGGDSFLQCRSLTSAGASLKLCYSLQTYIASLASGYLLNSNQLYGRMRLFRFRLITRRYWPHASQSHIEEFYFRFQSTASIETISLSFGEFRWSARWRTPPILRARRVADGHFIRSNH